MIFHGVVGTRTGQEPALCTQQEKAWICMRKKKLPYLSTLLNYNDYGLLAGKIRTFCLFMGAI